MLKAHVGLMLVSSLISGYSFASHFSIFSINKKVANECIRQGNYNNLEYVKSYCHVKSQNVVKINTPTVETFDGDCSVTANVVENDKVELVFKKNPNRYNTSSHVDVKEAKNCLETLIEEENNLF